MMKTAKETCNYKEVMDIGDATETDADGGRTKSSRRNLMRQLLICSTMWTIYFIFGLQIGAPTVVIPQLRKEANSTVIDDDLSSWITSMFAFGCLPWSLVLPTILHRVGRRKTFILICTTGLVGNLLIYFSKTIPQLLFGEFVLGIIVGSLNTISPFIITEYTSPKHRGLYLTIKSASGYWGMWVANIIGTFCHWKNIYLLMFLCNIYSLTVFFWPESPYWLAKEERFDDCKKTHRKLKGLSKNAEKELDHLINYYKFNKDKNEDCNTKKSESFLISFVQLISCKSFYRPLFLAVLLGLQFHFFGKLICSMYAIQILKKITGSEAMAYKGMLILDGVTVFSSYCGCVVSKFCKRRTLLFSTSFLSIALLYIFSFYLFLIRASIITENNIISIFILAVFSVTVCCGPMILLSSIYGELVSIKYQRLSATLYGVIVSIVTVTSLKISLFLFKQMTLPGTFLFFAISSTIITCILFIYMPETKNKSVHEIEDFFTGITRQRTKNVTILTSDA